MRGRSCCEVGEVAVTCQHRHDIGEVRRCLLAAHGLHVALHRRSLCLVPKGVVVVGMMMMVVGMMMMMMAMTAIMAMMTARRAVLLLLCGGWRRRWCRCFSVVLGSGPNPNPSAVAFPWC